MRTLQIRWYGQDASWCRQEREILWTMERTGACKYQWAIGYYWGAIIFIIHTPPVQIRWCGRGAGWCHQEREILWTMERTGACKYQWTIGGGGYCIYYPHTPCTNQMVRSGC